MQKIIHIKKNSYKKELNIKCFTIKIKLLKLLKIYYHRNIKFYRKFLYSLLIQLLLYIINKLKFISFKINEEINHIKLNIC